MLQGAKARAIHVLEIGDLTEVATRLIGVSEIDGHRRLQDEGIRACAAVDRNFVSVEGNRVVACACGDGIRTATSVDRVSARTGDDRIRRAGANNRNRCRQDARVDPFEVGDRNRIARGLVRAARD